MTHTANTKPKINYPDTVVALVAYMIKLESDATSITTYFDNCDESVLSSNTKIICRAINVSTLNTIYHNRSTFSDILVVLGAEIIVVGGLSMLSVLGLVGRQCRLRRNCVNPIT